MSQIDWKMVEAEVKHLHTLPLYTLVVTHNLKIILLILYNIKEYIFKITFKICETKKQKHSHAYRYTHMNIHISTHTHAHIHTHLHMFDETDTCTCLQKLYFNNLLHFISLHLEKNMIQLVIEGKK